MRWPSFIRRRLLPVETKQEVATAELRWDILRRLAERDRRKVRRRDDTGKFLPND